MKSDEPVQSKSSRIPRVLLIGCLGCGVLSIIGVVIFIIGGFAWLFTSPEGGVRLSNQVEQYAIDYIQEYQLLDADEVIVAYYDVTVSSNGTEAAILTDRRIIYDNESLTTSFELDEIADVQHSYDSLLGDIIIVSTKSGQAMKIEIAPLNDGPLFHTALLNAWKAARESSGAVATNTQVVEINAQAIVHYDRGNVYQRQGNFDLAIEEYTEAIALDPGFVDAYYNRGEANYSKGDLDRAIADWDQAISLDPQYVYAYVYRGIAYADKGDLDRAITDYDQAIALDPGDAMAYNNRGIVYADKGDLDRAITDYDQAIALDPGHVDAYNNRGFAYADKGDLDRAITDYDQAIALDPGYVDAYNHRGIAYTYKGDLDRAIADLEKALELGLDAVTKKLAEEMLEDLRQ